MTESSGNLLLDYLPPAVRRSALASAETVQLAAGEEIIAQGDRAGFAFFPASAVCSLTMGLKSGDKVEAAMVGREGLVGLSLLNGMARSPFSAIVHSSGDAQRIPLGALADLLQQNAPLRDAVLLYGGFALNVVGRSVACNSYHSIEERLARWLLMTHDRIGRPQFQMTHDVLSQMLAATRPRVSLAAGKLRAAQIIDYRRGVVEILDRKALEQVSCECYEATRKYLQMLPWGRS